jgi:hypothetical protein
MKPAEIAELLTLIAAAWPRFEPDDAKVILWSELFADVDFEVAKVALKKLMLLNTFPPSVAELRQAVMDVKMPDKLSAPEAWGLTLKAIHIYGYYREAEALESLPEQVAEVVRWMGWQSICMSDNVDVVRGQFMRMYETQQKRDREQAVLPTGLRDAIARIGASNGNRELKKINAGDVMRLDKVRGEWLK